MDKLYKIENINFQNSQVIIKKVELIFDVKTNEYKINNSECSKNIICVNGTCELHFRKNNYEESISVKALENIILVEKDIDIYIKNFSDDIKIVIEYLNQLSQEKISRLY